MYSCYSLNFSSTIIVCLETRNEYTKRVASTESLRTTDIDTAGGVRTFYIEFIFIDFKYARVLNLKYSYYLRCVSPVFTGQLL